MSKYQNKQPAGQGLDVVTIRTAVIEKDECSYPIPLTNEAIRSIYRKPICDGCSRATLLPVIGSENPPRSKCSSCGNEQDTYRVLVFEEWAKFQRIGWGIEGEIDKQARPLNEVSRVPEFDRALYSQLIFSRRIREWSLELEDDRGSLTLEFVDALHESEKYLQDECLNRLLVYPNLGIFIEALLAELEGLRWTGGGEQEDFSLGSATKPSDQEESLSSLSLPQE